VCSGATVINCWTHNTRKAIEKLCSKKKKNANTCWLQWLMGIIPATLNQEAHSLRSEQSKSWGEPKMLDMLVHAFHSNSLGSINRRIVDHACLGKTQEVITKKEKKKNKKTRKACTECLS
jgi:hypothetical protein